MVDNEIVERGADGSQRLRFRPVPAVTTPQAMDDLALGLRRALLADERPGLVVAPLAVLDVLCIHPFTGGNGRVCGRCSEAAGGATTLRWSRSAL